MSIMYLNSNTANARQQLPIFGTARTATLTATAGSSRIDRHRIFDYLNEP